jgi:ribosomal protein S6--L-glutamate ligase
MVISFHPCFVGDRNIICAGRPPGGQELSAIKSADAVVLPQGCSRSLYEMACNNCPNVFPNYDVRFQYPGKTGQVLLFREMNLPHPQTSTYATVRGLLDSSGKSMQFRFPFVFKYDWGGEGETVFLIKSKSEFSSFLKQAARYERSGHGGCLIQEYVPTNRSLRIARIGKRTFSYWRVMDAADIFGTSITRGARIDADTDPELQRAAVGYLEDFCEKTGINLAGFDALFSNETVPAQPLFIDINYFFGRKGLGGSETYYRVLEAEIHRWLDDHRLSVHDSANR